MPPQRKPEWASTRFWEYVLKEQFFTGWDWTIASQQPPTNEASDLRRVDLRIERWANNKWNTILLFKAKKQECTQTKIDNLESQAYDACLAHLLYTGRSEMYAVTSIGTSARLWYATMKDNYLLPVVPQQYSTGSSLSIGDARKLAIFRGESYNVFPSLDKTRSKDAIYIAASCLEYAS
ncbi:MAG: hypothetical protein M1818_003884 [Claussenomyces sp. TS43310]|nr:MAG: hypothetical protein M1818_003884 [Claussenomyces sp. TS43310]